jgi:hypothetical protein
MKVYFDFQTRQALQVATAVAEEIIKNVQWGRPFLAEGGVARPVLFSINGTTFRFEGGIVVEVFMEDVGERMQEFLVEKVSVRYYLLDGSGHLVSEEKVSEEWGAEKLFALKEKRKWWHPHVDYVPPTPQIFQEFTGEKHIPCDNSGPIVCIEE